MSVYLFAGSPSPETHGGCSRTTPVEWTPTHPPLTATLHQPCHLTGAALVTNLNQPVAVKREPSLTATTTTSSTTTTTTTTSAASTVPCQVAEITTSLGTNGIGQTVVKIEPRVAHEAKEVTHQPHQPHHQHHQHHQRHHLQPPQAHAASLAADIALSHAMGQLQLGVYHLKIITLNVKLKENYLFLPFI